MPKALKNMVGRDVPVEVWDKRPLTLETSNDFFDLMHAQGEVSITQARWEALHNQMGLMSALISSLLAKAEQPACILTSADMERVRGTRLMIKVEEENDRVIFAIG